MDVVQVAKICHQANKAFCEALGDYSQDNWEDAPQEFRDSSIAGVRFRLENPELPASAQHDAWVKDKIDAGWKYGPVKSTQSKTHPCIVEYDALPTLQQAKDRLFLSIVNALPCVVIR